MIVSEPVSGIDYLHLDRCRSIRKTMDNYAANSEPVDDSILYDQDKHVSAAVWEGQVFPLCNLASSAFFYR